MAYRIRNITEEIIPAFVASWNAYVESLVDAEFHADITSRMTSTDYTKPTRAANTVAAANATDTATAIVVINECKLRYNEHVVDDYAHDSAASAVVATANATTLATGNALAIAMKTALNAHFTDANVHFNNDSTNTIATADATNEATLVALANAVKAAINAHIASAPGASMLRLVAP